MVELGFACHGTGIAVLQRLPFRRFSPLLDPVCRLTTTCYHYPYQLQVIVHGPPAGPELVARSTANRRKVRQLTLKGDGWWVVALDRGPRGAAG